VSPDLENGAVPLGSRDDQGKGRVRMPRFFGGIDYSEGLNDVAVIDAAGTTVAHIRAEESPQGVKEILAVLRGLSASHRFSRRQVPLGIETRRGLLVAGLLASGQPIVPLNPAMVARYRGRLNPARRKSDRTDATLLAQILRTDGHHHRGMPADSDEVQALNELVQAQYRAVRSQRYGANQLRSLLRTYYPAAIEAWSELPGKLVRAEARALLALAPTPREASRLSKRAIADTLAAAGRTRLVDAQAARLREVFARPWLRQPPAVEEAMGQAMLATLAQLNSACRAAEMTTVLAETAFRAHPQAPVYLSLPGCGPVIGARLLAAIGDDPERFETAKGLRCYAGAAPLTWASGGSRAVTARRRAVNLKLKGTGHIWAFASLTRSPGCRAYYDRCRDRGDTYPTALRKLYGRLLNMLHHCLAHDVLYDEAVAFPAVGAAGTPRAGAAD
jgi:transposase